MKIVRFTVGGAATFGVLSGDEVAEVEGDIYGKYSISGRVHRLNDVRLLAPCQPSKIIALGKNYAQHAKEMESDIPSEPLMFIKPSTSVINPGDGIILPAISQRVDYEAELVVVIKNRIRNVRPDEVGQSILGFTCGNDVTARDLQLSDGQWTRGKSFDTFAPLGPFIVTDLDPSDLSIELLLNGKVRQSGRTSDMIFKVPEIVSAIARVMTLLPGDVIMTGTPAGVGPMKDGDAVEVRIEGIGSLRNRVRNEGWSA